MTTDRDLIELAARAMGRTVVCAVDGRHPDIAEVYRLDDVSFFQPLHVNPMTDCMGDALRLAVRLGIDITFKAFGDDEVMTSDSGDGFNGWFTEPYADDRDAATRRAITRAAAEIARATAAQKDHP